MKSIFLVKTAEQLGHVYGNCDFKEAGVNDLDIKQFITEEELKKNTALYKDVEYIFSTWYMPVLTEEEIKTFFPALKCVFYAAGTCKYFAEPYLKLGVRVFTAKASNAVPVAEFTVAQILLANKGYFRAQAYYKRGQFRLGRKYAEEHVGNYMSKIGIIGAGAVGRRVIELLSTYKFQIYVYDPFLTKERADELNVISVEKVQDLFEMCDVISNHLPDIPDTLHMIDISCFGVMKQYATFINTGRGRQVVEKDLVKVFRKRKDLCAVLDVSRHEPAFLFSPLYQLKNVFLSPHIAGSIGQEKWRMADEMLEAYSAYKEGKTIEGEVTLDMLKYMA